jgi:transcription factor E2F3
MSLINSNAKSTKQFLKSKQKRPNKNTESNKKQKLSKKNVKNAFSDLENDEESDSIKSIKESLNDNEQEEENSNSKLGKQENSLSLLTQNFLDYIKKKGRVKISINDLVNDLKVKKRRIYDITNVLQGIGYLDKMGKNNFLWIKNSSGAVPNPPSSNSAKDDIISENYISNYSQLKKEFDELKSKNKELDDELNKYREEFKLISQKNEFKIYGYITHNDIVELSKNEKVQFMLIKAPKGTLINVIDDEESRKAYNKIKIQMENGKIQKDEKLLLNTLENQHHIFFSSQDKEIKIYKIEDGKIMQKLFQENNNSFLSQNIQNNINGNANTLEQKNSLNTNNIENNIISNNQFNEKNSSEKNNSTIFNFDQFNIDNSAKKINNKQIFNFDNIPNGGNIKQNLNNKLEQTQNNKNNINIGISNIFKV